MISIDFASLSANPLNSSCSFVSDFTACYFNTGMTVKVTQNPAKKVFQKNLVTWVTFYLFWYK